MRKPKILVTFEPVETDWRAMAYTNPDSNFPTHVSSVGTVEECTGELEKRLPDFELLLTCVQCGNSASRMYDVSHETGICEYCLLSPEEKKAIADDERKTEEYIFGLPDVDYGPDPIRPEY